MEKEEKVRKGGKLIGEKLKRGVLIRNSTPSPTWKFGRIQPDGTLISDFDFNFSNSEAFSARKLGANLWEMLPQNIPKMAKLSKIGPIFGHQNEEPAENHPEQMAAGVNLGEQVAASLTAQHNLRVKDTLQTRRPPSPASYCSSMEMPPYKPEIHPSGLFFSKGKLRESSQTFKTSTELLKVLNRIWSLEEKHALDMSSLKTLRSKLDQSQTQIQELLQQKKTDQREIDKLTKQLTKYKVSQTRENNRLNDKLGKGVSDSKFLLSNALGELNRERKARMLLENLSDEFAKGVRDYEREVRFLKHKYHNHVIGGEGSDDRLIVHISEAWLDQRSRMKQSDLDKLCFEIEGFLEARRPHNNIPIPIQSLESLGLNELESAVWKMNNEDDSIGMSKSKLGKDTGVTMRRSSREGKNTLTNPSLTSDIKKLRYMLKSSTDSSMFRSPRSPVEKWMSKVPDSNPRILGDSSRSLESGSLKETGER